MAGTLLHEFQDVIGYRFRNLDLLLEALTHSSYVQEDSGKGRDNERLEFLGDAVLNFLVSVRLVETFPEYEEGELSRARARLVTSAHLAEVAGRLGLGKYLRMGRGEEKTGGREKSALRVNALEALVAALYHDGGLDAARLFVEKFVLPPDLTDRSVDLFSTDFKSALQEHLQASRHGPAEYRVVEEKGPEHRKTFTVEVATGEGLRARGKGKSKKAAEQQAAECLLANLAEKRRAGE
jgi:ribonuclease III